MRTVVLCGMGGLLGSGCQNELPNEPLIVTQPSAPSSLNDRYAVDPSEIVFLDDVDSAPLPEPNFLELPLTKIDGSTTTLQELAAGKTLVVVFTRGYNGAICPYCSTQTSSLIANYSEIQKRNAEVAVIYPLEKSSDTPQRERFVARVNQIGQRPTDQPVPFPLLVDVGLTLVDALEIRKDLSRPATYILDPAGAIRFAYVGNSLADRPSAKAILQQLDHLALPAVGP
jgi:peroxiredoxin